MRTSLPLNNVDDIPLLTAVRSDSKRQAKNFYFAAFVTMPSTSRSPLLVRAATYAVLRALKFVRHTILRAKVATRNMRYRIRETRFGDALWKTLTFARNPKEIVRRRRLAAERTATTPATMDSATGYTRLPADHSPESVAVLAACQRLFESKVTRGAYGAVVFLQWATVHNQCGFVGCDIAWVVFSNGGRAVLGT